MSPSATRRIAAFLALGLVLTSLPARVWLFGACPVCGTIHQPILNVALGTDPTPPSDAPDDSHDDRAVDGCNPPLPFTPTQAAAPSAGGLLASGELNSDPDPTATSVPARSLIRPPRA